MDNQQNNTVSRKRRDLTFVMAPKRRARRSTSNGVYKNMVTGAGKKSSKARRLAKKRAPGGKRVYYVSPKALLPGGAVVSCFDRWEHRTQSELRGFPFVGRMLTYAGSGYHANLGYNEETAWTVIADLHSHNWFDEQTRAIFIEFTVYNPNVNLFATAFLFTEMTPTGETL